MPELGRPEPSRMYRWIVLLFISLAQGGNYYIYDSINALEGIFKERLGFTGTQFGWLNTSYSIAALATLLIGGVVIDRIGTKKAISFFGALCLLGAILMAVKGNPWFMIGSRAVLGLGAESMIVAVTTALAKWFKGKELSFAFGINLTIARLASVAADNSPSWASSFFYPQGPSGAPSWRGPLWLAIGAGVLGLVTALIYWALESRAEARYELGKSGQVDKLEFKQIFQFNKSYWYVVGLCFTFYSAIFPFRQFAIDLFANRTAAASGIPIATAVQAGGFLNSLLPLSAMIATPLFGLLADRIGKRAFLMMGGSVLLMPVYLIIAYAVPSTYFSLSVPWIIDWHFVWLHSPQIPLVLFVPVTMLGIAFSLIPAVMWPSVAYIVDQSRLGTAYALMTFIQQIGMAGLSLMIGKANDYSQANLANPGGYALGMWIFSVLGFVGLAFAILLRIRETGPHGHGLETITTAKA